MICYAFRRLQFGLLRAFKAQKATINLNAMYCAGAEVPITLWQDLKNELKIKELMVTV